MTMAEKTIVELASEVVMHIKERDYGIAGMKADILHSRLVILEAEGKI